MSFFKDPTFQERTELAKQARLKALEKLKAKPPVDEAVLAERRAAFEAKQKAEAEAREAKKAAREQEIADKKAAALEEASRKVEAVVLSEAEKKAARDARYAARKNRKK